MFEIVIEKIKSKKISPLIEFLLNKSTEIGFSVIHDYKLDENSKIELIDEFRAKCKQKHHELTKLYNQQYQPLMKSLRKLGIKDEKSFHDYQEKIFQADIQMSKKIEETFEKLDDHKDIIDYKIVFSEIADGYKLQEVHMFDSADFLYLPVDILIYNITDSIRDLLKSLKNFSDATLKNNNKLLLNPTFFNDDEGFAIIQNESNSLTMVLSENDYNEFKKLKIKHTKDYASE